MAASRSIIDLNVSAKTVRNLEENIGICLLGPWTRQRFLGYDTKTTSNKKIHNFDFITVKNFCAQKATIIKVKKNLQNRKYLQIICLTKDLY